MAKMYLHSLSDSLFQLPDKQIEYFYFKHVIFGFPTKIFAIHHLKQGRLIIFFINILLSHIKIKIFCAL